MNSIRAVLLVIAELVCASVAFSQTVSFQAKVSSNLPVFQIEYSGIKNEVTGFSAINSIAIRQNEKTVQTIHFSGDDVSNVRDLREAVQLRDINCDGYKDLLIEFLTGIHGDWWYHLYLFQPEDGYVRSLCGIL